MNAVVKATITCLKKELRLILSILMMLLVGCSKEVQEINIGYIGPLSKRATDLGLAPSKAMQLAVEQYNLSKKPNEPVINLYIEDDQWEKENALPLYKKLRKNHNISVIIISNTDGTVAIQDQIIRDGVICINPLNSDELLSSLNKNTFKIAKRTEEANALVAIRIAELGLKKTILFHYPNDFMTRGAYAAKKILDENQIENTIIRIEKNNTDFRKDLSKAKKEGYDSYIMFGYKSFGFAMKQARDLGITAPFFGSTTQLVPEFYDNSEGAIIGSEFPFFTPADGNYFLANKFLKLYEKKYGETPFSIWPPMQAYDAVNLAINELRNINIDKPNNETFADWLRSRLYQVNYYQGICGNIAIGPDRASKGIYFSLYEYVSKGKIRKIKR